MTVFYAALFAIFLAFWAWTWSNGGSIRTTFWEALRGPAVVITFVSIVAVRFIKRFWVSK